MTEQDRAEFWHNIRQTKAIIASWPKWQQETSSTCMVHGVSES